MFCAAFRRFVVVCRERSDRVLLCRFSKASLPSSLTLKSTRFSADSSTTQIRFAAQFISSENMSPRGKAKAKKDVGENGKERRVRESRNVKAASYKDLSDSEDEKPIRKRKQKSESEESMSEEEMPKKKVTKGRKAPVRSKREASDSEEASEFSGSDESSGNERKRKQPARKPTRSLRVQRGTSYKEESDSGEDSAAESKSSSEREEKSPSKSINKGGRSSKAASKSKKQESSASGSDDQDEDADEPESEKSTEAESAKKSKVKEETLDKDDSTSKVKDKSRPEHALSEDEGSEEEDSTKEEDSKEEVKKDVKKEENDSKKRGRSEKSGGNSAKAKPPAKKAKVEDKPKLNRTDTDYDKIDFSSDSKSQNGEPWNFKISSWNVASLRTMIQKGGLDFIKYEKPDILCLQEIKCSEKKLPPEATVEGYHSYWCSGEKEGYAGVALLSKVKPLNVEYGVGKPEFDIDGRVITAEYEKFFLVNVYVPNAGQGLKTLPRREEWDPVFRAHLKKLDEKKPVILCGDMNVSHLEIDLANPKTNTKSAGFTPQEREGMTQLLKEGFVDTFRKLYPDKTGAYSFWTYLQNARSRNVGWRLDYFITSERFFPSVCDNVIRSEVYGSDHCPITLFVHME